MLASLGSMQRSHWPLVQSVSGGFVFSQVFSSGKPLGQTLVPQDCVRTLNQLEFLQYLHRLISKAPYLIDLFCFLLSIFAFKYRITFRFISLDYRRTKAFRTSTEDLPSKYSWKMGENSSSCSRPVKKRLHEAIQGKAPPLLQAWH